VTTDIQVSLKCFCLYGPDEAAATS